jgi:hypothetical protein
MRAVASAARGSDLRAQSVSRTSLTLHASMLRTSEAASSSKTASTVTLQPLVVGKVTVALAFGPTSLVCRTVVSPAVTAAGRAIRLQAEPE